MEIVQQPHGVYMLKSIYTPMSGALAQEKVMDIIANNLANINTVGYKSENVTFKVLHPEPEKNYKEPLPPANYKVDFEKLMPLRGNEIDYVEVSSVMRDTTQGPVQKTENPLDLMIEGEGYFSVNTKDGIRYSRDGSFSLNQDGLISDKLGNPILGEKGVILARDGLQVNSRGEVILDGKIVDKLKLVTFTDEHQLEKVGNNHYFWPGSEAQITSASSAMVRQGFLEASNVNPIKNLTSMIIAHRSYEAYQKSIKNMDSMMEKSSNQIGTIRA
jgi:flagellar basal-body rod protein FlgG